MRRRDLPARPGWTLLELMIVVAIIGIMASLLMAAVFRVRPVADDVEARREIVALHNAVISFCTDARFGAVGYLPSRIDPSGTDPLSAAYFKRLFPTTTGALNLPAARLEGDQCLVLFLGGPNNNGWATDPADPTANYGMRIKFYEFDPQRIRDIHGDGYPSYLDRWGTPIAYFSPQRESTTWAPPTYQADCTVLGQRCTRNPGMGLPPYAGQNMGSFQLISAGRDALFGQKGNLWTPTTSRMVYPETDPGCDDIANFAPGKLGAKQ
jgi:prepilin-type N-terminal cleavage/methylation domain-containing protein